MSSARASPPGLLTACPWVLCRVLTELVSKMKDMQMDKSELGCLRAIVLFNPGDGEILSPSSRWLQRAHVLQPSSSAETEDVGPGHCPWGGQRVSSAQPPLPAPSQKVLNV